jgi:hypothetical protein
MRAMNDDVVSFRRHADRCERLASRIGDPTIAQNLRDAAAEYHMRAAACSEQVKNIVDRATCARERALQAAFPEDKKFWLDMEAKWLSLAGSAEHVERTSDMLAGAANLQ